jgi:heat shock protein HslJ
VRTVGVVTRAKVGIALGVVALAGVSAPALAGNEGAALFGHAYTSVKVVKDREPHPLFDEAKVHVKFFHQGRRDFAGWRARCNEMGGRLEIRPKRLEFGSIYTTLKGCRPSREKQDRWLMRFFGSDPGWALDGRKLKLAEGDDRIVFRRR